MRSLSVNDSTSIAHLIVLYSSSILPYGRLRNSTKSNILKQKHFEGSATEYCLLTFLCPEYIINSLSPVIQPGNLMIQRPSQSSFSP